MLNIVYYDNDDKPSIDIIKCLREKGVENIKSYKEFDDLYMDLFSFHTTDLFIICISDKYQKNRSKIKCLVDKFGNTNPILFLTHPMKTHKEIILYTWFKLRCFYSFKPLCFVGKDFYRDVGNALTTKRKITDVKRYNFW